MNDMMNIIGVNIKTLRKSSGLSQDALATFLDVDQSFISKIEKGERQISSDMLEKITELFGITTECIINENPNFNPISFALRAGEISVEDLDTIQRINKIALNLNFMNQLIEEEDVNG